MIQKIFTLSCITKYLFVFCTLNAVGTISYSPQQKNLQMVADMTPEGRQWVNLSTDSAWYVSVPFNFFTQPLQERLVQRLAIDAYFITHGLYDEKKISPDEAVALYIQYTSAGMSYGASHHNNPFENVNGFGDLIQYDSYRDGVRAFFTDFYSVELHALDIAVVEHVRYMLVQEVPQIEIEEIDAEHLEAYLHNRTMFGTPYAMMQYTLYQLMHHDDAIKTYDQHRYYVPKLWHLDQVSKDAIASTFLEYNLPKILEHSRKTGISWQVAVAVALNETGFGVSRLGVQNGNPFAMKWRPWMCEDLNVCRYEYFGDNDASTHDDFAMLYGEEAIQIFFAVISRDIYVDRYQGELIAYGNTLREVREGEKDFVDGVSTPMPWETVGTMCGFPTMNYAYACRKGGYAENTLMSMVTPRQSGLSQVEEIVYPVVEMGVVENTWLKKSTDGSLALGMIAPNLLASI